MNNHCTVTTNSQSRGSKHGAVYNTVGASKATALRCHEHSPYDHGQHTDELVPISYLIQLSSLSRKIEMGMGGYSRLALTVAFSAEGSIAFHSLLPWISMDSTPRLVRPTLLHAVGIKIAFFSQCQRHEIYVSVGGGGGMYWTTIRHVKIR